MTPKTFVSRLKTFLKQAKLSGPELAETIGLKERTMRSWLSGDAKPSPESILDVETKMKAFHQHVVMASAALDNFFAAA